jgi:hypothetical protein
MNEYFNDPEEFACQTSPGWFLQMNSNSVVVLLGSVTPALACLRHQNPSSLPLRKSHMLSIAGAHPLAPTQKSNLASLLKLFYTLSLQPNYLYVLFSPLTLYFLRYLVIVKELICYRNR